MSSYLFVIGGAPELGRLELKGIFPQADTLHPHLLYLESDTSIQLQTFISQLGGTVKVASVVSLMAVITPETLSACLENRQDKVVFGVTSFSSRLTHADVSRLVKQVKDVMVAAGRKVRYVESDSPFGVSGVVHHKETVQELVIGDRDDGFVVGVVNAVQPYEAWADRDFGRPESDARRGMLPPKVARMVVNIASDRARSGGSVLCDPFCGAGTVVTEALLAGKTVIASDVSEEAVRQTRANCEWLQKRYPDVSLSSLTLHSVDATHLSRVVPPESIDMIVTEPFMGDPRIVSRARHMSPRQAEDVIRGALKGLEKLYTGCVKEWFGLLRPGGVVMIAIPEYHANDRIFRVKNIVDNCEKAGYTTVLGPVCYARKEQLVHRNFYLFGKGI